jgi:hypothetical protein
MTMDAATGIGAGKRTSDSTETQFYAGGSLSTLFTHEDPFHLHKTFGLLSLIHFAYRLAQLAWTLMDITLGRRPTSAAADAMGFGVGRAELPLLLAMHAMLSLLSFVFRIPARRIRTGARIWPEFRLHSIMFAFRSMLCMLLVWIDEVWPPADGQPRYWANVLVVFATLIAVDISTWYVPPDQRSNTIRGIEVDAEQHRFFTTAQFLTTTNILFGLRSYASNFVTLMVVQLTAFTLTLHRKNLLSHVGTMVIYAFMLIAGIIGGITDLTYWAGWDGLTIVAAVGQTAQTFRVLGVSKYVVWAVTAVVVQYARRTTTIVPPGQRYAWWPWWGWPVLYLAVNTVMMRVYASLRKAKPVAEVNSKEKGI